MLAGTLLKSPTFVPYFPYFLWLHIALIVLGGYGLRVLRNAPGASLGSFRVFLRGLPIWLMVLAVPVAISTEPLFSTPATSLGVMPDGQPVTRKSWIEENGKHFVVLNRTVKIEISEAERQASDQEFYGKFSSGWILFSYLLLVLWDYNRRREVLANAV